MQDCYVGDVGDFVKYGLLRALSDGKRLGVAWYLRTDPDTTKADDGSHTTYLQQPEKWRHLDPVVFDGTGSVFDSRTANVHVDETNNVAYAPYPMKLLKRLVRACRAVKSKLEAEIAAIEAQTPRALVSPDCSQDTEAGRFLAALSAATTPQQVETLATLSPDDQARLAILAADLVQDPRATAARLHAEQGRLDTLTRRLEALSSAVSDVSARRLHALREDYRAKREAARVAAQTLFTGEPLSSVGSDAWRALWDAARAYSTVGAYAGRPFPVTDDEARCVLCQQSLDPDAATRLRRFEEFVQDRTSRMNRRPVRPSKITVRLWLAPRCRPQIFTQASSSSATNWANPHSPLSCDASPSRHDGIFVVCSATTPHRVRRPRHCRRRSCTRPPQNWRAGRRRCFPPIEARRVWRSSAYTRSCRTGNGLPASRMTCLPRSTARRNWPDCASLSGILCIRRFPTRVRPSPKPWSRVILPLSGDGGDGAGGDSVFFRIAAVVARGLHPPITRQRKDYGHGQVARPLCPGDRSHEYRGACHRATQNPDPLC